MKKHTALSAVVVLLFALAATAARSQTTAVHGQVTDASKPLPSMTVTLTRQTNRHSFNVKTDKDGKFEIVGLPAGEYEVVVATGGGEELCRQTMNIAPDRSGSTTLDLDVSAIKKQEEKTRSLNILIKQANDAIMAKNWQEAAAASQQLVAADPNNWQYYSGLGDAQLNLGQYDQAVSTYQRGIDLTESTTTVDPHNTSTDPAKRKVGEGHMLTSQGNAYLKLHKNDEAIRAYIKGAAMDPNPALAYFNVCAVEYNTGNTGGALEACDKAIAADPGKADAYFIKGSLLLAASKTDSNGRIVAPAGAAEALDKYLELAPNGPRVDDVKQMLQLIGSPVPASGKSN